MDRAALADFLRRRREALQPADVGIPATARRRTPGLRREDVATLAMMSTDYYTRLEQQRGPQPSEQMLGSLARALRLTSDERDYLFQLAGHTAPAAVAAAAHVPPALLRVLDRLDDTPALLVLTAPPRTEGYEKLQLLSVLGQERFADTGQTTSP
jgi:transcriptional regulator with XRE-family HTH domain